MPDTPTPEPPPPARCQAIPVAARRGWRTDLLCASTANSEVAFCGRLVPVCRIHRTTYERWHADAEANAIERWGWNADPAATD
jgi:hypothetical protein